MPTYDLEGNVPQSSKGRVTHLSGAPYPSLPVSSMIPSEPTDEITAIKEQQYTHEVSPISKSPATDYGRADQPLIESIVLSQRGHAYVRNGAEDSDLLDVAILCLCASSTTPSKLVKAIQNERQAGITPQIIVRRMMVLRTKHYLDFTYEERRYNAKPLPSLNND